MPEISRFRGIVIRMYYLDHELPHFHVDRADEHATVLIESAQVLAGSLSSRTFRLVRAWARLHQPSLLENWRRLAAEQVPRKIPPLER
jgi:hypothetical protein